MDIVTQAKNIGAVMGTAYILAYATGYLTLRYRAHTLGIDSGFKLIDEAYVFAGFRFLFTTLIVLLLLTPVILVLRSGSLWLFRQLPIEINQLVQWLLLVSVTIITMVTFKIFGKSGLLLRQPDSSTLYGAILGEESTISLLIMFSVVLLVTLSAIWLQARLSNGNGVFEWVLGLVVALQVIMLPIYHGAFFADRKVWVLAQIPDVVMGINAPLGIVSRTSDNVTLLGLDVEGERRLVTLKLDDLNGIPIKRVVPLKDFVGSDLVRVPRLTPKGTGGAVTEQKLQMAHATGNTIEEQAMTSQDPEVNKGFFTTLADYLQVTLEAIGSLGDSVVESGQLWTVELDDSGTASESRQIGSLDDLAWPVAGPDESTFYALQRGRLIRLGKDGEPVQTFDHEQHWRKLLGVAENGTLLGLVTSDGETKPALLDPNGGLHVNPSPLPNEEKTRVARLMQENRSYVGNRALLVDRSERGGRGFDVFLKVGESVTNLSDCGDDSCGQASLAPDLSRAVFIRQSRY